MASIDYRALEGLDEKTVEAISYMQRVESAVWGNYLQAMLATPTSTNPQVAAFLPKWAAEEANHSTVLWRILEMNGGPREMPPGTVRDNSLVARIFGDRIFGGVLMAFGATNERMTAHGYKTLANNCDNEELKRVLMAIAKEESLHYSFYFQMAKWYLGRSRVGRWLALLILNRYAQGVGIGVVSAEKVHEIMRILFAGAGHEFVQAVEVPISKLPGMENFNAMTKLVHRAEIV